MGSQQRSVSYSVYILLLIHEAQGHVTCSGASYSKSHQTTEYIVLQTDFSLLKRFIQEKYVC
jgi:hypothetical protein